MIEYIKQWTGEYFNEILCNLKLHDEEYADAVNKQSELSESIYSLLDDEGEITLNADMRKNLIDYFKAH